MENLFIIAKRELIKTCNTSTKVLNKSFTYFK